MQGNHLNELMMIGAQP